jgi:hypothetical protein
MIREAFANPKWWLDSQLELETEPDDSPRQVLRGNSQGGLLKPEILQPAAMPDNQDGEWITSEMMHIVGLHEVSQAQVPGRVEAAKAIEMLKESDANRQSNLLDTIKTSISEGWWQLLMLTKQYVPEEQIVQTYSREGLPEVKRFKSENIKPAMRVNVTMTTGLARSRAARSDQLLNMWDRKIIQDPEVIAELLEVPIPTLVSHKAFDIRLARNENLQMSDDKKPVPVKPNSWDDHQIHIREHNNFRKTQEYLLSSDETKKIFEFHVTMHEDQQVDQLAKLAQKQAILQAAAAGPSTPTPEQTAPNADSPPQPASAAA